MHCNRKVTDDLIWVGVDDRRLAMFEGVYSVPKGVSYNSYLLLDEKTVLFDTVDKAVLAKFLENLQEALADRDLDYLVVHHMEPDHSAGLAALLLRYPKLKIVCTALTKTFIEQFYQQDIENRVHLVEEGDVLKTGNHELSFMKAPMVHWPEVMVSYDKRDKILFSADAFGSFGALNGALFADELAEESDYLAEARRYYCNIVGKYGSQVTALLKKALQHEIAMICPLHGPIWRKQLYKILTKYQLWSSYAPEQDGVMIAYASVYGNTENVVAILANKLVSAGIKTVVYDTSVTPASEIVAAAFRWSHLVFASTTYNAGIFVTMDALLSDLVAHNIQKRQVALIENGSWAATSGALMKEKLAKCQDLTFIEPLLSIKSSLNQEQLPLLEALYEALLSSFPASVEKKERTTATKPEQVIDYRALFDLSYGLFILSAQEKEKDNGCIINTVTQITEKPLRITIAVNKANLTHDMIKKTGKFNVSVLTQDCPFTIFESFGFHSGRDVDKFDATAERTANGICYFAAYSNAVISAQVLEVIDCDSHSLFIAEVTEAFELSKVPSLTYQYYFDNIKPRPQLPQGAKNVWVCKICGYVYGEEEPPEDYICPLCKHGKEDFELVLVD